MDPRGPQAVGPHGHHEGRGGAGQEDRQLQAGDRGREGLRGDVSEVVSDEGCVHVVGDPAAAAEVPGSSARLGAHV